MGKDPPTLSTTIGKTTVTDAHLWLFPVVDDYQGLVLSAEGNGGIIVSRIDPLDTASFGSPSWTTVASTADTGGENIADHWHIYAHGYHWISFSTTSANKCFLLKMDMDFNRIGLYTAYTNKTFKSIQNAVTNDHFLVEEKKGVAIALFQHGDKSSTGKPRMIVKRFTSNGGSKATKFVPADSPNSYSNGGSAYLQTGRCPAHISPCFMIFVPEKIDETVKGDLIHLIADKNWQVKSSSKILSNVGFNYSMSSMGYWKNNFAMLTVKKSSVIRSASSASGGKIMRYVVDGNFKKYNTKTISFGYSHRPHTVLYSKRTRRKLTDYLITCWDQSDSSPQAYMRVDMIS